MDILPRPRRTSDRRVTFPASADHPTAPAIEPEPPQGRRRKIWERWQRSSWLQRSLFGLGVVAVAVGLFFGAKVLLAARNIIAHRSGGGAPALAGSLDLTQLKGEGDGRINILLLGIGGKGWDGPYLSDTIIVASIDPQPGPTEPLIYPQVSDVDRLASGQDDQPAPTEPTPPWFKTILLGVLNWLVIPVVIVFILHNFVFQAFHVIGSSMSPTLHENDYLIISKIGASESALAKDFGKSSAYVPKRGEVIVFHYPKDPTLVFIKRVIGLPGERVVVQNGTVTIYNSSHPTGFNPDTGTNRTQYQTLGSIDETVPAGNIFVLGDNRSPNGSYDSRDWGMLPSSYIIGDAIIRLLPVDQAGVL